MTNSKGLIGKETTLGDAAVDGLLAGGGAGVLMAIYLALMGLTWGNRIGATLGLFDPGTARAPAVGLLAHLAVAAVYGALFGAGWRLPARLWPRFPLWLAGLGYGLALWGLAAALFVPGAASALAVIPPVHFAIAHGLYGLALGIGLARRRRNADR